MKTTRDAETHTSTRNCPGAGKALRKALGGATPYLTPCASNRARTILVNNEYVIANRQAFRPRGAAQGAFAAPLRPNRPLHHKDNTGVPRARAARVFLRNL